MRTRFENASVLDAERGTLVPDRSVVVEAGRIVDLDASSTADRTIDVRGRVLMPGLIDCHVHVTAAAAATIAVTAGLGQAAAEPRRKRAIRTPRATSCATACPKCGVPCARRSNAAAQHIKLMLSGGVASPTDRVDSTQCGVRSIEHGNLMDASSPPLFLAHNAFYVPTLVTYSALAEHGLAGGLPEASYRKIFDVLDAGLRALEMADRAGVPIAYGTDLLGAMHVFQNRESTRRHRRGGRSRHPRSIHHEGW